MRYLLAVVLTSIFLPQQVGSAEDSATVNITVYIGEEEPQDAVYEYCEGLLNGSDTTTGD